MTDAEFVGDVEIDRGKISQDKIGVGQIRQHGGMDDSAVRLQVCPGPLDVEVLQQRAIHAMERGITVKEAVYSRILLFPVGHHYEGTPGRLRQWVEVYCQHVAFLGATH